MLNLFLNRSGRVNPQLGQLGDNGEAYRRWQQRVCTPTVPEATMTVVGIPADNMTTTVTAKSRRQHTRVFAKEEAQQRARLLQPRPAQRNR